jgi:uncharacterized repeat protein (TIGR03803 family)
MLSTASSAHATTAVESTFYTFASDEPSQLIQAHDGNFYGTSPTGGASGYGYVFRIAPGGAETAIYNFTGGSDGGIPEASLIEGNDGNLYGTNTMGGSGIGILFSLTLAGAITPVYDLANINFPGFNAGALIQNNAGDFFGATYSGGGSGLGTVFEYTHTGTLVQIHSFTGSPGDGSRPNSQLLQASDGLIYGATAEGGVNNTGSFFRFTPATPGSFATIASLPANGENGYGPEFGMTEGPDGTLYGLTIGGGINGYGSIYEVGLSSAPAPFYSDLYDLNGGTDGGLPASGLFLGGDGNFYGTSSAYGFGGSATCGEPSGTFFQYIPTGSGAFATLYPFSACNGSPTGTPLQAADGNFYGPASRAIYKIVATPAVTPPVTLTASATSIALGSSVTLTWQVNNAFSQTFENCYAHGDWSGSLALSGSEAVTPGATGIFNYSITCGGVESAFTSVKVTSACSATNPIVPYIALNGVWNTTSESAVTVATGSSVSLGPWPLSGGAWSWTGPNGFTSTSREIDNIALSVGNNAYTATYTVGGCSYTQAFVVTVNAVNPIVPYIAVNGVWNPTPESAVTVASGASVSLGPWPLSGGSWSWTGSPGFGSTYREIDNIPLNAGVNTYIATYTVGGASYTQTFTITLNGCGTNNPIIPEIAVNGNWNPPVRNVASVAWGSSVDLGPQTYPASSGTWSWAGPNGFTSTAREIDDIPLSPGANIYTATYTTGGCPYTMAFTVTLDTSINPIIPVIAVNGAWEIGNPATSVALGSMVDLSSVPRNNGAWSGGSWSWTGPNGFTASTFEIDNIPLSVGNNAYTVTYTIDGFSYSFEFGIVAGCGNPIVPYIAVNGVWNTVTESAVTVASTTTPVALGPWPFSGGSWSWTGPNGFTSTSREIDNIALTAGANVYTATFTVSGCPSNTQAFTVTVN